MGLTNKAKNKILELKGRTKWITGKATDNRHLQLEGKSDQVKANIKQAGERVKDAFD